jgi:Fur family ferric uptake transcriptional regulator
MTAHDVPSTALRTRLRAAGLRVTAPRLAVLSWLTEHPHDTEDAIAEGVRDGLGSVSTQAVHDILSACTRAGLLRRVEPAGYPARFETRAGGHHHHLRCRGCGRTEDVDCAIDATPRLDPSRSAGYAVYDAEVVFWGLCPDCRSKPECATDN